LSSRLLSRSVKVKIYETIILTFVLYGCDTWSLTLREEHRLRVFGNRVLRKIFGPNRNEVLGQWSKLHSGELHNLYSSPDISRQIKTTRMGWAGHVARVVAGRNMYKVLMGKPEEGVDGTMGLEWILGKLAGWGGGWSGFTWLG
jgi:hypothetical protein